MNFNTQRVIIKNLSEKAEKHKIMLLPCLIATGFVMLWGKISRAVDVALSDKDGNFLGIKREEIELTERKQPVILEHRPIITRITSFVLSLIFIVSFTPGLDLFATWISSGSDGYYDNTLTENQAPSTPIINTASTLTGYGAVEIFWTGVNYADGYEIYVNSSTTPTVSVSSGTTSAIIYNLDYVNATQLTLKAYNDVDLYSQDPSNTNNYNVATGKSIRLYSSGATTSVVAGGVLSGSLNVSATLNGETYADITWSPVSDAQGYNIYRRLVDTKSTKTYTFLKTYTTTELNGTYIHQDRVGLTKGEQYEYVVIAYKDVFGLHSGAYDGTDSDYIFTARDASKATDNAVDYVVTDPDKPNNLKATTNNTGIKLTWSKNSNADGYYIYRSDTSIDDTALGTLKGNALNNRLDILADGSLTYQDNTADNLKTYYYYVSAYRSVDGTVYEGYAASLSTALNVVVSTPTNIIAIPGDGTVSLSWDSCQNATGYEILGIKTKEATGTAVTTTVLDYLDNGSSTSYVHRGLYNGEVYQYTIRAYTVINGQKVYNTSPALPVSCTVGVGLIAPQDVVITTGEGYNQISWSKVTGAEGYKLYGKLKTDSTQTLETTVTGTKFTHSGLNVGDEWEYYVIAYKTVTSVTVYSDASLTVSMVVGLSIDAPKDLSATTTDGEVTLKWSASKGAEGYILYVVQGYGSYNQIADITKTTATHTGLTNNTAYTYTVRAYKTVNGYRVYSDYSFPVTITVGVNYTLPTDLTVKSGDGQLTISWSKVTDVDGYILYAKTGTSGSFSAIADLTKTTYTHQGLKNGQTYTYKVAAYKYVNGTREFTQFSMEASGIPLGSNGMTSSGVPSENLGENGEYIDVTGTTPYGISHGDYITAEAIYGAFDDDVEIHITTNLESTARVKACLSGYANGLDSFAIFTFDIAAYLKDTMTKTTINPGYTVTMTIPVPDKWIKYKDYINVIHISDMEDLEILPSTVIQKDDIWCMQFVCSDMSPFAFVIYKDNIENISMGNSIAVDSSPTGAAETSQPSHGFTMPDIISEIKDGNKYDKKIYRIKTVA